MKGVQRSAIAMIPLTTVSSLFLTPVKASPLLTSSFSIAQVESTAAPASLPAAALNAGTQIPVVLPGGNPDANLVMTVGETFETSFEVATNVLDAQNNVIIPQGSTIAGVFASETIRQRQGARFKANQVIIDGQSYALQATSAPFVAKRRNQITANDVRSSVSTIAAATVVDSLFNRVGRSAGIDRRIIRGAKRGAGVGVLPTVLKTGQELTQKANSPGEVIVVSPNELGLTLDTAFQNTAATNTPQLATQTAAQSRLILARGTQLGLRAPTPGTRYVVDANESFPVQFRVANDVVNPQSAVVIPKGSLVKGTITPSTTGSVFKASQVVTGGQTYPINAQTAVVAPTEVSTLSPASLRGNTVTSPQASSNLSKVKSGGSSSGGGFLGQLLGTGNRSQVIIFDPATTPLELTSDFSLGA